jgi:hypothetical protein
MQMIADIAGSGSKGWYFLVGTNGRLQFLIGDSVTGTALSVYSTTVLQKGVSYLVATRWSSDGIAVAVDGDVENTRSLTPDFIPDANAFIGSDGGTTRWLDGSISDFRVSSSARTDAEILAAYQSGLPLPVDSSTTYKISLDGSLNATPYTGTIGNLGTVDTYPLIEFYGPVTNPSITIGTFTLTWAGSLLAGETLYIDCGKKTVKKDTANGLKDYTGGFPRLPSPLESYTQDLLIDGAMILESGATLDIVCAVDFKLTWTDRFI